jgi:hypothetical protein
LKDLEAFKSYEKPFLEKSFLVLLLMGLLLWGM